MKLEVNIKQDQILEAAVRRFSHFGVAKTSLTEVAEDMAVSKQALSYYFHDKQSLVNAVIEKLTNEYSDRLKKEIEQAQSVEDALLKLTEVKGLFFEKYFMLAVQADYLELAKTNVSQNWRKYLLEKESGLLTKLFENGVQSAELKPLDARKTAELLLETLYAFSRCVKDKGALPDAEAFKEVMIRQQEVIKIFYQGLKRGEWTN
jgi:TetR/AcrR family transcriptional regulator